MPSEFEQEILCISDPIDRIRAATGRVKSVKRDDQTVYRILSKYGALDDTDTARLFQKMEEAKQESADLVLDAIMQCRDSGINHSVAIVEAISNARAGEEKHYRGGDDEFCRPKRRR
jgi:hypothetical protein